MYIDDTATQYTDWLVVIVTCARDEHAYGVKPPLSFDATHPHADGLPPTGTAAEDVQSVVTDCPGRVGKGRIHARGNG